MLARERGPPSNLIAYKMAEESQFTLIMLLEADFFEKGSPALQNAHIYIAENVVPGYWRKKSRVAPVTDVLK